MSIGKVKCTERKARWVSGIQYEKGSPYSWFTLLPGKYNDVFCIYGYLPRRFTIIGSILK